MSRPPWEVPFPDEVEAARQEAIQNSLLVALQNDLLQSLSTTIDMLEWLARVLAILEKEVEPDANRLLTELQEDRKAWRKLENDLLGLVGQSAQSRSYGLGKSLNHTSYLAKQLEAVLDSRRRELSEIVTKVASASGAPAPSTPPIPFWPGRGSSLVAALLKVVAGKLNK